MKKILITGVAGFIGSHVAKRYIAEGYCVVGVDDLSSGNLNNIPSGVEFIQGDLAKRKTLERLPRDCKLILHLAGQSSGEISFDDPIDDLRKNTISTLNLIRYGVDNSAERIIYASSMSVYGAVENKPICESQNCKPLSCYGVSKLAAEGYLRVYGNALPFVSMRMFNVYGPGQDMSNLRQGMISIYLAQALKNGKIEVKGNVDRFRDFIFIDDVVEAWYRASISPSVIGCAINVGTGIRTTVGDLLQKISMMVPNSEYWVNGSTPGDQSGIYADTKNLKAWLDMDSFITLDTGLEKFVEWAGSAEV